MALIGLDGPEVVLSAETAYWIDRAASKQLATLRARTRDGHHQRMAQELLDLRRMAMSFDPTSLPHEPEVGSDLAEVDPGWLWVAEVADLLGIGERAVRLACAEDRLDAEQVGRRWRISRQAVENFKAARAA